MTMMTNAQTKAYNDLYNDGAEGYVPEPTAEEIKSAMDAERNAFSAEWTADVTTARRNAWNARVKSGEFKSMKDTNLATIAQGWNLCDLKRAIALNNL